MLAINGIKVAENNKFIRPNYTQQQIILDVGTTVLSGTATTGGNTVTVANDGYIMVDVYYTAAFAQGVHMSLNGTDIYSAYMSAGATVQQWYIVKAGEVLRFFAGANQPVTRGQIHWYPFDFLTLNV